VKESRQKPERSKKSKRTIWIYNILIVAFLGIAIYSGYRLITDMMEDRKGSNSYEQIAEQVAQPAETTVVQVAGQEQTILLRQIDFEALFAINPDVVAWLECEGTIIDYPVVQGTDNSYYLKHLLDGTQHRFGTLFVDKDNTPGFVDDNTIIYGHHIKAGDMFYILKHYREEGYYEAHPYFMLYTPEKTYRIDLFAGFLTSANDNFYLNFGTEESFAEYIAEIRKNSTFESPVEMTPSDQMVTLYTCAYDFDEARYILCGKLVELK